MRLAYVTVTEIKRGALVQVQTVKYLKNNLDKLAIDFGVNLVLIHAFICSNVIANLTPWGWKCCEDNLKLFYSMSSL
jgi:hypothetical protein